MKTRIFNTNTHRSQRRNIDKYKFAVLIIILTIFFGFSFVKAEDVNQTPNSDNQTSTTTNSDTSILEMTTTTQTNTTTEQQTNTTTPDYLVTSTPNQSTSSTDEFISSTTSTTSTDQITTSTNFTTTTTSTTDTTATTQNSNDTTPTNNNLTTEQLNNTPTSTIQTPITELQITNTVDKILAYLKSQQDATGKIIDGTITDWIIMSFGANGQYANEIKNTSSTLLDYEKNYNLDDPSDLNPCASYPRHILALLAAGVDKNDAAILGLKNKISTVCYQNNLYGQPGINDDVFALISLLAIDDNTNNLVIQSALNTIKADQTAEGAFTWTGWAGADMTGAAINALKYAESKGVVIEQNIYSKAKQYLKINQLNDGGWGYGASDILTTSWVLMGINALGEGQNLWFTASGTSPWHPLVNQLKTDGFYESAWVPGTVDWFAMKHAVPALLKKSWPIILPAKIEKFETSNNITYTGGSGTYTPPLPEISTNTVTTTPDDFTTTSFNHDITTTMMNIPTTALEIATTTEHAAQIVEPTTTVTITNNQKIITKQIQNLNKQKINNDNLMITTTSAIKQLNNLTISSAPSSTPVNPAKTVFGISLTMASGLGLYLAWRLLQTLV